ncbi:MAG: hypothetical protein N4A76_00960 [Firmicutes bacterium]|jgi:hypothetical protein|nr:hypothetical protein [Bacillota bacterium]
MSRGEPDNTITYEFMEMDDLLATSLEWQGMNAIAEDLLGEDAKNYHSEESIEVSTTGTYLLVIKMWDKNDDSERKTDDPL